MYYGSEFLNAELIGYCEREKITFTRGRPYRKNDQCYVEQKNGTVVRQFVGYDRFEGLRAYKQLLELYRALRLYINFFQPSMKLKEKQREGSRVHRMYESAQTPFQRLRAYNILSSNMAEKITAIHQAIDPVRLLEQIGTLQDALWRHAVLPTPAKNTDCVDNPEVCFKGIFDGSAETENSNSIMDDVFKPETRTKRKYRKTKKTRIPHWWRNRPDPFELVNEEIRAFLEQNPERTAKSILQDIQKRYPEYTDGQLRTLQRRVKAWRAQALIAFDDSWIQSDKMSDLDFPKQLRGETLVYASDEIQSQ